MIINPQPMWLIVFLLCIPGIVFSACAINSIIFPPKDRPLATIPAIALVVALLPTHLIALAFGSLNIGIAIAWTVIGLAGYAWQLRRQKSFCFAINREHTKKLAISVLAVCPIIPLTILYNFHDEAAANGHQAIIASLQNGTYPPRYLFEPLFPLQYHYGFDIAGVIITDLLRIRPDQAIDILTLGLWLCTFFLLWQVGNHFGEKRAGLFVALTVCYGGGFPAFCFRCSPPLNPPFISNFFQHPWSIGVPIFCLVILQRAAIPRLRDPRPAFAMLACSLSLLSLCEAVLFVSSLVSLGISEVWSLSRNHARESFWILLIIAISLLGAKLVGGFFAFWPSSASGALSPTSLVLREYSGMDVLGQARWDLGTFGALLFLGGIGLKLIKRDRTFLLALTAFSLLTLHGIRYKYTWDIVKFATVASISLSIGAGIILSELWTNNEVRKSIFALLMTLLISESIAFIVVAPFFYRDRDHRMIRPYFSRSYPIDKDNADAISYLRTHMGPGEIAFRTGNMVKAYANWGGLPTQNSVFLSQNRDNDSYGMGNAKIIARIDLYRISPSWFDRLSAVHIGWLITDKKDVAINKLIETSAGRVSLIARYGDVRIFRVR